MLLFESMDDDTLDRTVSPMVITSPTIPSFSNVLNSFMDHLWDGFYTSQKRLSRFPSLIKSGEKYLVSYSGTPPSKQRFTLMADSKAVTIQIKYTKPGSYYIKNDRGKLYEPNAWDESAKAVAGISGKLGCGENRFVGVENILEFYLTAGCTIYITPKDAL